MLKVQEGAKIKEFSPEEYGALMSQKEASLLKGYMEDVVMNGTGSKLSGLSYTALGKTGSAEFNSKKKKVMPGLPDLHQHRTRRL